jgi:cell division protein FtsW (lipid II flippase)
VKKIDQNRSFGLLLGAVCAIFAVLAYRAGRSSDTVWAVLAVVLLALALFAPRVLAPALRGWLNIGHWLGIVINPLVLAILYVVVFVPFGALMRLRRHDPMGRNYDAAAASYWIARKPGAASAADSLKEQF